MGALVGGRISGVRYWGGRVLATIQDLLLEEGFSTFCAAVHASALLPLAIDSKCKV